MPLPVMHWRYAPCTLPNSVAPLQCWHCCHNPPYFKSHDAVLSYNIDAAAQPTWVLLHPAIHSALLTLVAFHVPGIMPVSCTCIMHLVMVACCLLPASCASTAARYMPASPVHPGHMPLLLRPHVLSCSPGPCCMCCFECKISCLLLLLLLLLLTPQPSPLHDWLPSSDHAPGQPLLLVLPLPIWGMGQVLLALCVLAISMLHIRLSTSLMILSSVACIQHR
jgi:hypothetical protein